jgi:hypothetical protein
MVRLSFGKVILLGGGWVVEEGHFDFHLWVGVETFRTLLY